MNGTPGCAPRQADATKERPRSRLHVRIPDQAKRQLRGEVYRFFAHIIERSRFAGWTDDSERQLAFETGLSVSTVKGFLRDLKRTKVDGCDHTFLGTDEAGQFPRVNGRRRLYPVDQRGNETIPPGLKAGRISGDTSKSARKSPGGAAPTIGDSRASLSLQEQDQDNDPPKSPPERQRPEMPALDNASTHCAELVQSADTAGTSRASSSPKPAAIPSTRSTAPDPSVPRPATTVPAVSCEREPTDGEPELIESLTGGQREFLDGLTEEQRAKFDGLPIAKRREMLKPHANGLDRIIADEHKKFLRAGKRPDAGLPIPPPMTAAELIARLPNGDVSWIQRGTEMLVREFGSELDRKLWRQIEHVLTGVWNGRIDANAVLHVYHHARKPRVKKPGAYFWTALQDRAGITADDLPRIASPGRSRVGR